MNTYKSACGQESSRVGILAFERGDPRCLVSTVDNLAFHSLRLIPDGKGIQSHDIDQPVTDALQAARNSHKEAKSELGTGCNLLATCCIRMSLGLHELATSEAPRLFPRVTASAFRDMVHPHNAAIKR